MTPQSQLDSLRALLSAATPGPWDEDVVADALRTAMGQAVESGAIPVGALAAIFDGQHKRDAALIVALRNGAVELLDEVERLRSALADCYRSLAAIYEGDDGPVILRGKGTDPVRCARKYEAGRALQKLRRALHPKQERDDD